MRNTFDADSLRSARNGTFLAVTSALSNQAIRDAKRSYGMKGYRKLLAEQAIIRTANRLLAVLTIHAQVQK